MALKLIKEFGTISGSVLNAKKSFIIEICSTNKAYFIEDIPVLENTYKKTIVKEREITTFSGEFRKILGIYFASIFLDIMSFRYVILSIYSDLSELW